VRPRLFTLNRFWAKSCRLRGAGSHGIQVLKPSVLERCFRLTIFHMAATINLPPKLGWPLVLMEQLVCTYKEHFMLLNLNSTKYSLLFSQKQDCTFEEAPLASLEATTLFYENLPGWLSYKASSNAGHKKLGIWQLSKHETWRVNSSLKCIS